MKKKLYLALGFFFCGLGAVGVVLPILPTVPFLLLASFFFAKGSQRYHRWFCGTRLYQNHLQEFVQSRAMTLRSKLTIVLPVSALVILTMILVDVLVMRIVLGAVLLLKYWYFIFRIRTIPKADNGAAPAPIANDRRAP